MRLWHLKLNSKHVVLSADGVTTAGKNYGSEILIHPYKFGISIDLTIWIHNIEIGFYMILKKGKSSEVKNESDL